MSSKDILIERLGGEGSYKILMQTYCNHIRDNEDLEPFFGHLTEQSLTKLEEDFLDAAFTPNEGRGSRLHRRVKGHHRRLFEKGLNETHFDSLKEHFLDALNDFCLEDDAYESCNNDLDSLRYIFEESARRHSRGSRYRRSSVGHSQDGDAPEQDDTIAGIPRRCTSLPPVRKASHISVNIGVNKKNIQKGIVAVTRSGDKLMSMFNSTSRHPHGSHGSSRIHPGVQRSNSGDMVKTMFNANKQRHSGAPVERSISGDKIKAMFHATKRERNSGDAVERTSSGEKLKAMLHATTRHRHADNGEDDGIKRTSSGDSKLKAMKRTNSGDRLKAMLNPGMRRTNSGDKLNGSMKRSGSGDRLKAILGMQTNSGDKLKAMKNASFRLSADRSDANAKRNKSADELQAILNDDMKHSHSGNKLEVN